MTERMMKRPEYVDELIRIIRSNLPKEELLDKLSDYHDNDIAEALDSLTASERKRLYSVLGVQRIAQIFAYLDDAKKAYQEEKWEAFKVALRKAQNSVGELMQTLDFSYDISRNLYQIYVFCKDSLAAAMYKRSLTEIENAEKMLRKLYQSFCKVAETDSSAPMMKNTQQVYAGYTYGKGDLVENCQELDKSRGFFA